MGQIIDLIFGGTQDAPDPVVTPGYRLPPELLNWVIEAFKPLMTSMLEGVEGAKGKESVAGLSPFEIVAGNLLLGMLPTSAQPGLAALFATDTGTPDLAAGQGSSPAAALTSTAATGSTTRGRGDDFMSRFQEIFPSLFNIMTSGTEQPAKATTGGTVTAGEGAGTGFQLSPISMGGMEIPFMGQLFDLAISSAARAYTPMLTAIGSEFLSRGLGESVRGAELMKTTAADVTSKTLQPVYEMGAQLTPFMAQFPLMLAQALGGFGATQRGISQQQLNQTGVSPGMGNALTMLMNLLGTAAGSPIVSQGVPGTATPGLIESGLPWYIILEHPELLMGA